ncbi:hypothetical protein [Aeromonas veronii]
MKNYGYFFIFLMGSACLPAQAGTADDKTAEAELAKKLANPVASLISVPFQYNYDEYSGINDGASVERLLIQPVIPFSLNEDWNVITRTIFQGVAQHDFPLEAMNVSGFGDTTASQFFSPKAPTANGWIWGVGPVELLPTASDEMLGSEKWGLGPTAVVLRQTGPWTVGLLTSQIWSVTGDEDRDDLSVSSLQPFASYTTKTHTTIGAYTESTYDWKNEQWSVPLIVQAGQMLKVGPQIMQLAVAGKYWAEAPENGPDGWGLRVQLTLLFPQ